MREKKYHIYLTDDEQSRVILMAMKSQIVKEKNQHTPMLFGLTQFYLFPK